MRRSLNCHFNWLDDRLLISCHNRGAAQWLIGSGNLLHGCLSHKETCQKGLCALIPVNFLIFSGLDG